MHSDAKNAADAAHKWLSSPGNNETMWVITKGRDSGVDITARMAKHAAAAPERPEIPHDALPTFPGFNQQSGRAVFVLCQPDHVPTIQTTMQGTLGELRNEDLTPQEARAAEQTMKAKSGSPGEVDDALGAAGLEQKYLIDATDQDPSGRNPDLIIVDNETVHEWSNLGLILEETKTLYTDRATA